jgi:hypothetical protein
MTHFGAGRVGARRQGAVARLPPGEPAHGRALVCGRPLELSAWRSPAGGAQGAERP